LFKTKKYSAVLLLVLLASMALTMAPNNVYAQEPEPPPTDEEIPLPNQFPPTLPLPQQDTQEAYVTVVAATGGITFPPPGAYKYPKGDWFNLTAVPYKGFKFLYWTISGEYLPGHNLPPIVYPLDPTEDYVPRFPDMRTITWDSLTTSQNPLNVICGYGYNYQYQPVFMSISEPEPGFSTIVSLLTTLGGTSVVKGPSGSSNPAPGTYSFASGQGLTLEATPAEGYDFSYWIATGPGDPHPVAVVDNPVSIECQEGTAYTYQPLFVKEGQTVATEGIPDMYFYAAIVVLVIMVVGLAVLLMMKSKARS